jgi:hypothetical protein
MGIVLHPLPRDWVALIVTRALLCRESRHERNIPDENCSPMTGASPIMCARSRLEWSVDAGVLRELHHAARSSDKAERVNQHLPIHRLFEYRLEVVFDIRFGLQVIRRI